MPIHSFRFGPAGCLIATCLCILLCGCVGATRLPVKVVNPAGIRIQQKEIDLSFLQAGTTQRDEVAHQLAPVDTSYDNPRIFWGRWSESRWGYWWVLGWPCDNCMAGDAGRLWRMKNLLVTFDENGLVSDRHMVNDAQLWRTLHARIAAIQPPTLDLSQPVRIPLTSADPMAIRMSQEGMEFERPPESGKPDVQVAPVKIVRFKHSAIADGAPSPSVTCHTLELSERTPFGKKIKFCSEASYVGILFEYLQQAGPPTMKWE